MPNKVARMATKGIERRHRTFTETGEKTGMRKKNYQLKRWQEDGGKRNRKHFLKSYKTGYLQRLC